MTVRGRHVVVVLLIASVLGMPGVAWPADWPTWRHDAQRSARSPEELPRDLRLQWVLELPEPDPCWPFTQHKLQFDLSYEPVVMGDTLFVPSMVRDSVSAYDTEDGDLKWRFYTDGPVRFAPAAYDGKVYFVSDDGYLYCLDAASGAVLWRFRGGPSERKVLGNERLVSMWPARGAPVVYDDTVYFAASIWPFMGTFIYALEAETGEVVWANSGSGSDFILQPHSNPAFAGVAPQGYLAATEDKLLVAGGRSVPAVYDRRTGKLLHFETNTKLGGYASFVEGEWFFNDGYMYKIEDGSRATSTNATLVVDGAMLGVTEEGGIRASSTALQWEEYVDRRGETQTRLTAPVLWELGGGPAIDKLFLKAGSRVYAGRKDGFIAAIELPSKPAEGRESVPEPQEPTISWQTAISGEPWSMLAANDKLFVVTTDGRIYCFGGMAAEVEVHARTARHESAEKGAWARRAEQLLDATGVRQGYCLVLGLGTGRLAEGLVRQSDLYVIGFDPDADRVDALRREFDAKGLYGERIALLTGDITSIPMPPYLASLVVWEDQQAAGYGGDGTFIARVFHVLRPYGGVAAVSLEGDARAVFAAQVEAAHLQNAAVREAGDLVLLERSGALPGSAPWTHQYGDVSNTVCSRDALVKPPLGLLWFGGPSNVDVLPRHGHGPPEQVVGGRLFIEGIRVLSARDVYTGRVLWRRELPYLNTFDMYYNQTHNPDPYDRSYNQVHIPGASAYGTNYVATVDKVYVAQQQECLVLDAATGETIAEFGLPATAESEVRNWGYIGVYEDLLIAGAAPLQVSTQEGKAAVEFNRPFAPGSRYVVVMDRHSGKVLWEREAAYSFRHNTIVAGNGKLFCIDGMPKESIELMKRRGIGDQTRPRILALDIRTGRELWSVADNVFGTWLGYSQEHDVLLQAGSRAGDRAADEVGEGMSAYAGSDGKLLWASDREYAGPCILYHDKIITQAQTDTRPPPPASAFELLTGDLVMRTHPLTGEEIPWGWTRLYGCNTAIGGEHMLTFRSASAAYSDLWTGQGVTSVGGFKSGCTSNLVAADGVLNSPDYTRTCTCSYQNQTSLALYHMPAGDPSSIDVEGWSFNSFPAPVSPAPVNHVGINLGAPGDRLADDGVLWLEYPSVGGLSPDIPVHAQADHPQLFRYHMSYLRTDTGAEAEETLAWVAASGIEGLTGITIWPFLQPAAAAPEGRSEDYVPCYDGPDKMTCTARVGMHAGDPLLPQGPAAVSGSHEVPWRYTVRLHFAEPKDLAPGERVFDAFIQGKKVLDDFDIVKAAGGARKAIVVELTGIEVETDLRIVMAPSRADLSYGPLLCGIELAAGE